MAVGLIAPPKTVGAYCGAANRRAARRGDAAPAHGRLFVARGTREEPELFEAPPARSRCRPGRCRKKRPCRVPARRRGERGARHRSYRSAARSPGGARGKSIRTRGCLAVAAASRAQSTPDSGLLRSPRMRNTAGPSTGPWGEQAKLRRSRAQVRRGACDRVEQMCRSCGGCRGSAGSAAYEQQVRRGGQAGEAAISRMGRDGRGVYPGN